MEGKDAIYLLLVICMFLAVQALSNRIDPKMAGLAFAAALAVLGVLSRGFRRRRPKSLQS